MTKGKTDIFIRNSDVTVVESFQKSRLKFIFKFISTGKRVTDCVLLDPLLHKVSKETTINSIDIILN